MFATFSSFGHAGAVARILSVGVALPVAPERSSLPAKFGVAPQVQGDHLSKIEALLVKLGCVKGVTHSNIAAATAAGMATNKGCKAPGKSIPRLDKKAAQPGR